MIRHRAQTRYRNGGKHRGKTISRAEVARRKAQSLGWSIKDTYLEQPVAQQPVREKLSGDTVIIA